MKYKLLIIFLLFVLKFVSAQNTTFFNTYNIGYDGKCVVQTNDNGFLCVGLANGVLDICLIKTNSDGDTLWSRTYGGPYHDIGYSVQQNYDDGFIIAGMYGEPDSTGEGYTDAYIIKTDEWGDTIWTYTIGNVGWGDCAYSVQQTTDSCYIACGVFNAALNGGYPIAFLMKLGSGGSLLWSKTYPGFSYAYSVIQTFDGGYAFAGYDGLVKTDSAGSIMWSKTDDWEFQFEDGEDLIQTTDSCMVITGRANLGSNSNLFLCKIDNTGDVIWAKEYDNDCVEFGMSIDHCSDGGYIVTGGGCSTKSIWLLKANSNGDTLWTKKFGISNYYNEFAETVTQCNDGGFIITGKMDRMFILKTDSLGNAPALNLNVELHGENRNQINVYPNPAASIITVECNCNEPYIFKLYNLFGKEIKTEKIINNKKKIDVSSLPIGIYVYMIIINDKEITSGKVIIN